jgi:hypothetical protein
MTAQNVSVSANRRGIFRFFRLLGWGVVMTLLGGFIGTLIVGIEASVFGDGGGLIVALGIPFGCLFTAPVTLFAFPVVRSLMPAKNIKSLVSLLVIGVIAGAISPFAVMALFDGSTMPLREFRELMRDALSSPSLRHNSLLFRAHEWEILSAGVVAALGIAGPYFYLTRPR